MKKKTVNRAKIEREATIRCGVHYNPTRLYVSVVWRSYSGVAERGADTFAALDEAREEAIQRLIDAIEKEAYRLDIARENA